MLAVKTCWAIQEEGRPYKKQRLKGNYVSKPWPSMAVLADTLALGGQKLMIRGNCVQQTGIVTIHLGNDLVLLVQPEFLRVVIGPGPGSWIFTVAATFEDRHPHCFTRVTGLPGIHPAAQEPTTHKKALEAGTLVSHPCAPILVN